MNNKNSSNQEKNQPKKEPTKKKNNQEKNNQLIETFKGESFKTIHDEDAFTYWSLLPMISLYQLCTGTLFLF